MHDFFRLKKEAGASLCSGAIQFGLPAHTAEDKEDNRRLGQQTQRLRQCADHAVPVRNEGNQQEQSGDRADRVGELGAQHDLRLPAKQDQAVAVIEPRHHERIENERAQRAKTFFQQLAFDIHHMAEYPIAERRIGDHGDQRRRDKADRQREAADQHRVDLVVIEYDLMNIDEETERKLHQAARYGKRRDRQRDAVRFAQHDIKCRSDEHGDE